MNFAPGHTGQIRGLAFSPDGKRAVSASSDKTCRVWDVNTGKTLRVFDKHTTGVGAVAYLSDGRHVASIAWDNAVRIWDPLTGDEIYTIKLPAKGQAVAAAPNGRTILAGCTRMSEAGAGTFNLGLWQLPAQPALPGSEQWVQLFNGKDLTGWKTHPDFGKDWQVNQGLLVGRGPNAFLFSEGGEFVDCHVRVEARINKNASGGCFVRAGFGPRPVAPDGNPSSNPRGYKVSMATFANLKTGSLFYEGNEGKKVDLRVSSSKVNPDEWFTAEAIVRGNHIVILVNGEMVVDHIDPNDTYQRGHLALTARDPNTVVQFRKIEIKELPSARGRYLKDIAGLDKAVVRVNESFDDPATSFFRGSSCAFQRWNASPQGRLPGQLGLDNPPF